MSIKLMNKAWNTPLPLTHKMVLLALADASSDEGRCWPSILTMARKCGASDRTIQITIKALMKAGYLVKHARAGRSTLFQLLPENWEELPAKDEQTPEEYSPPKNIHPRTTFTPPPNQIHPTPERRSPRTIKEP